jgi:micrococcal nuclease
VGQVVTLRIADTDRYGRSVANVYVGDTSINLALVQKGQAAVYRQYLSACPELREQLPSAEASAKQRRLGLWAQANPVMPWDYRHLGSASAKARPQTQPLRTSLPGRSPALQANPSRGYNCSDFKT